MASRTPIELWANILDEVVHVPHFFSTDPLAYDQTGAWAQHFQELPYWRSERRRNRLRRVHSSWDTILSHHKYQHRYVRLVDVVAGKVPSSAIPQAIRLSTGFNVGEKRSVRVELEERESFADILRRLLAEGDERPWRTQVIDFFYRLGLTRGDMLALLSRTPALGALLNVGDLQRLGKVAHGLKVLTYLEYSEASSPTPLSTLNFSHLTTLGILLGRHSLEALELVASHFGQLRHLYVHAKLRIWEGGALAKMVPILKNLGRELLSFHVNEPTQSNYELPSDFWELLPQMRDLWQSGTKGIDVKKCASHAPTDEHTRRARVFNF